MKKKKLNTAGESSGVSEKVEKKQRMKLATQAGQVEVETRVGTSEKMSFWYKIIPPSILTILTVLFYYPSLKYPFQFDDLANISKHFAIRFDNPLARWWSHTRWMADWLNSQNYQIGRFDPVPYRIVNLAIHIITGLLVFFLILELFKFLEKNSFLYKNSVLIAFATAAFFLLHPVQTQAVSYVIQARMEGLATMFIVAIVFGFVKTFTTKNLFFKIFWFTFALLCGAISCGTKEIIIVVPALILLVDWFFISQGKWANFKKRFIFYASFILIFALVVIHYLGYEIFLNTLLLKTSASNNRGNILTNNAFDTITASHFLISEFKVVLHYLAMFLWPSLICVEYDWKLSESFFAADSFFPFLVLVAIFSFVIFTLIKNKNNFFAFGFLWFWLCVAPRTTIYPCAELLCDYKTYLASIGIYFIFAVSSVYVLRFAFEKIKQIPEIFLKPKYQLIVLTILFVPLGFSAFMRNLVWSTPSAFWMDIVEKAPLKARGHNNLGVALSEEGKVDEAIKHYLEAIRLDRVYADPWSNLAVAYSMKGEIDQAISALHGAIAIFPDYAEAYNNLGTLLLKKQQYAQAEQALDRAIQIRGYYGKAFYNKGRLFLEQGQEEKAWTFFKKATEGDLDTAEGFFTLGQMSLRLKKYDEAVRAFDEVYRRGGIPQNLLSQVRFSQANAYYMLKDYDRAQALYQGLTEEYPLDGKYVYNLAETYFAKDDFNTALTLFKKTTSLPEPMGQAHFRIVNCYEKLKQVDQAKGYLNQLLQSQAPDNFKKVAKEELARVELQQKLTDGKGSVKMSELQNILKKATITKTAQNKDQKAKKA